MFGSEGFRALFESVRLSNWPSEGFRDISWPGKG